MARRKYSREFKRSAVQLVNHQGYSVVEAAKSLGVDPNCIRGWIPSGVSRLIGTSRGLWAFGPDWGHIGGTPMPRWRGLMAKRESGDPGERPSLTLRAPMNSPSLTLVAVVFPEDGRWDVASWSISGFSDFRFHRLVRWGLE